jgi:hypothetical protein
MALSGTRLVLICSVLLAILAGSAWSMTIQLGAETTEFISPGDTWSFFRGKTAPSTPADAWTAVDFDDSTWETGPSGFGYDDNDDATILSDMKGNYKTVYIRKAFYADSAPDDRTVELIVDYDDGFIAYLNGKEVTRVCMPSGTVTYETSASESHEAAIPETFVLGVASDLLIEGRNVLAIEGHNVDLGSSDLTLTPALRMPPATGYSGQTYYVTTMIVTITGHTSGSGAATVMVDGEPADFDPVTGVWTATVALMPGENSIPAHAFNAGGTEVDYGSIKIVYVAVTKDPPAATEDNRIGGELTQDTTLSGRYIVESTVTVPGGRVLTIQPGATLEMNKGVSIIVAGQLLAEGTEELPIRFTRFTAGNPWKQIKFIEAADSTFAWCTFEYADSEGAHQDYYEPGPRDYHEAIIVLACHIEFKNCTFQKMPGDDSHDEGDAIAIFSDDQDHPGPASAHIAGCRFLGIGQGIHTRFAYVLVEDCYFQDKRGDNDDVDLWGESTPTCVIRRNLFDLPEYDDRINPTRCSAIITDNIIMGSNDHGMVLRDKSSPVVMNNLIIGCSSGGIAVENSCSATLINNTIVNCGRGIRLFDLGRAGPPYYLTPGGGTATITNCIIWGCTSSITLADSSNTAAEDRGSHVTVNFCDIQGGRNSVSLSNSKYSTVDWGQGNINSDPFFADAGKFDFHLESQFGRFNPVASKWVNDATTSPCIDAGDPNSPVIFEPFPNGGIVNMGAYGNTAQASKSKTDTASGTSQYAFEPNQSTVLQTGGFAGVHWPYRLEGQFSMAIDFEAGAASLSDVNAVATNDGPPLRTLDPNEVFNLTGLDGIVGDDKTVTFTGKAADGSDVELTLTFLGNLVHLVGETTPPVGSADMFVFSLDAWVRTR